MWKSALTAELPGMGRGVIPLLYNPAPATYGPSTYELLASAGVFLADLHQELGRAVSSIDMQFYTFECDSVGQPIAQFLMALDGMRIRRRMLIDQYINLAHNDKYMRVPRRDRELSRAIASEWHATLRLIDAMRGTNVQVRMTNPLGLLYYRALHRDHRKLVLIDADIPEKAVAYLGGINPSEHNAGWNDFMVKITGDAIPPLRPFNGLLSGVMAELSMVTDNPSLVFQLERFLYDDIGASQR